MRAWIPIVAMLAGCADIQGNVVNETGEEPDDIGPAISHDPIRTPQTYHQDILIEARAEDVESGVLLMQLVYQQETAGAWTTKIMREVGGGLFQGSISGNDVASSGMRYFLRATDYAENTSCLPEKCEDDAWHFTVVPN